MNMTYADQLNILSASVKLKRKKADKAFLKAKKGFKSVKILHRYLALEQDFLQEHNYYINFFTYCVRNIIDINIESEFKTI
jgi:hypothetical protein